MTAPVQPTRRVAVLAPMRPELKAVVRAGALQRISPDVPFSHGGKAGTWTVLVDDNSAAGTGTGTFKFAVTKT